jgi:acetyl-CoA C-acetyltransferase
MWDPVVQYAAIERALGARRGLTRDALADEIAELWADFNRVATTNPLAAFPTERDATFLRAAGPGNRALADPYAKWHSTQWTVDQAGAVVLCSAGVADELGVAPERRVVPHVVVDSSHAVSLSRRVELDRWPAMGVLGAAAAAHVGRPLDQLDHVELYSCLPSAVRVQLDELGLDPTRVPTLTGGMAFAGGPFNNFTLQSLVAMVHRLRSDPGSFGMVTSVSGLITKPGLSIWSTAPGGPPLLADLGPAAARVAPAVGSTAEWDGDATVLTGTVSHLGAEPTAFLVARAAPSLRWVGASTDRDLVDLVGSDELVGSRIRVEGSRPSRR